MDGHRHGEPNGLMHAMGMGQRGGGMGARQGGKRASVAHTVAASVDGRTGWPWTVPPWLLGLPFGEAELPGLCGSGYEVCHSSGTPRGPRSIYYIWVS